MGPTLMATLRDSPFSGKFCRYHCGTRELHTNQFQTFQSQNSSLSRHPTKKQEEKKKDAGAKVMKHVELKP